MNEIRLDVKEFCREVADIKEFAKRLKESDNQFERISLYLDICRKCEWLCKDCFGAEGISTLFGVEKKLF